MIQDREEELRVADMYHQAGLISHQRGDLDGALDWFGKALEIRYDLRDRLGMALTFREMGLIAEQREDFDEALRWHQGSLTIYQDLNDLDGQKAAYTRIGDVCRLMTQSGGSALPDNAQNASNH
ncbi:MAG: tetratricopeptide repeat protein [Myxococcales bacterium]|nr:tetratricopeptide repeat protein [Myxococcales bacterium]